MVNLLRLNRISPTASVSSVQSVPKCRLNSPRLHHRFAKHESLADAGDFSQLPTYQKRVNRSIQGMFRFTLLLSAIFLRCILHLVCFLITRTFFEKAADKSENEFLKTLRLSSETPEINAYSNSTTCVQCVRNSFSAPCFLVICAAATIGSHF